MNIPPIPKLVPSLKNGSANGNTVAVLIRSHFVDEKFHDLWNVLNAPNREYDIFPLLDNSSGTVQSSYPNTVWHSKQTLHNLGLHQSEGRDLIFWLCGDFPLYFAICQQPNYQHYIMVEYDVHFTQDGVAYLNQLCRALRDTDCDGVGLEFGPVRGEPGKKHPWPYYDSSTLMFQDVYKIYYPVVAVSRRGILQMFAQRQLESARRVKADQVVHCESFSPSCLLAAGLTCKDLNDVLPNSYSMRTMGLNHATAEGLVGIPLKYAQHHPDRDTAMIHAVYSDREFLKKNLAQRSGSRLGLEIFIDRVSTLYGRHLSEELKDEFLLAARQRLDDIQFAAE